jgi:hypothetical protein
MISTRNTLVVESLQELLAKLEPNASKNNRIPFFQYHQDEVFWYRGHSNLEWRLQPTLYRKVHLMGSSNNFWDDLRDAERKTYEEFEVRNYHLMDRPPQDLYLWLSLMQHNHLATRLLDWTEEAITAIFFAVSEYFNRDYKGDDKLPCLWVLRPRCMKIHVVRLYKEMSKKFKLLRYAEHVDSTASLLRLSNEKVRKKLYDMVPMPVLAPYTHSRIQAQSGVFTLFPIERGFCDYLNIRGEEFCLDDVES